MLEGCVGGLDVRTLRLIDRCHEKEVDFMNIDIKKFEKTIAENKVYDAWQYVQSLLETLSYMSISYEILLKVHVHRVKTLEALNQEKIAEAFQNGKASFTTSDLKSTNLNICGYDLDDITFLRKTAMEFFHYGRISMDVLFQIINAALLGDNAIDVDDKGLLRKLLIELGEKSEFSNLLSMITVNKNSQEFKYLMAFDNYMKHIKTILITVKNSFLIGNSDVFEINAFSYGGDNYPSENCLDKIKDIHDYVLRTADAILNEIMLQIPNCISNTQRIQELHYKLVFAKKEGKSYLDYLSFFIDVPNDISDLSAEIKVYPLIVKPNNEIYNFDFKFDTIFIRKAGTDEDIVGVARLKNGADSNEFYRTYTVETCQPIDYSLYIENFKSTYQSQKLHMNIYAMDGTMYFINE